MFGLDDLIEDLCEREECTAQAADWWVNGDPREHYRVMELVADLQAGHVPKMTPEEAKVLGSLLVTAFPLFYDFHRKHGAVLA